MVERDENDILLDGKAVSQRCHEAGAARETPAVDIDHHRTAAAIDGWCDHIGDETIFPDPLGHRDDLVGPVPAK